jgi:hypothetical protein
MPPIIESTSEHTTLTDRDRDALIRTVYGEARGETDEGKEAVISVVLNRYDSTQYDGDVYDLVHNPAQFSAWNTNDPNRQVMIDLARDSQAYQDIGELVDRLDSGAVPRPTNAINYYSPRAMDPPYSEPGWGPEEIVRQAGNWVTIGTQEFLEPSIAFASRIGIISEATAETAMAAAEAAAELFGPDIAENIGSVIAKALDQGIETVGDLISAVPNIPGAGQMVDFQPGFDIEAAAAMAPGSIDQWSLPEVPLGPFGGPGPAVMPGGALDPQLDDIAPPEVSPFMGMLGSPELPSQAPTAGMRNPMAAPSRPEVFAPGSMMDAIAGVPAGQITSGPLGAPAPQTPRARPQVPQRPSVDFAPAPQGIGYQAPLAHAGYQPGAAGLAPSQMDFGEMRNLPQAPVNEYDKLNAITKQLVDAIPAEGGFYDLDPALADINFQRALAQDTPRPAPYPLMRRRHWQTRLPPGQGLTLPRHRRVSDTAALGLRIMTER